ncbi:MAG: ABC transporter permease [Chloroflexi bacterium]|nr:ABC transporter permease [Chloroflexota bacterium]
MRDQALAPPPQSDVIGAAAPSQPRVWREVVIPLLLCAPGLFVLVAFFVVPLGDMFVLSFYRYSRTLGITDEITLDNYVNFLTDSFYLELLFRTLKLSALTTLTTLVVGYPIAAHFVQARGRSRAYLTLVILSPLMVSVIVRTYGWLVILGPTGVINSLLQYLGVTQGPIRLLFTELAVVLGLTHIFLPFMVLSIASALQNIDPALSLAARNLGAGGTTVFLRILLPLSKPGILAGSLLVFSLSNSAFVTPALLGGQGSQVLSVLAYQQNLVLLNWPFGAAIAVILLAIVLTGVVLYTRALERDRVMGAIQ